MIDDIDEIGSYDINDDNPVTDATPTGRLASVLDNIQARVGDKRRIDMPTSHIHSFRIATDTPSRPPSSARSYKVSRPINTVRPDARASASERAYHWRMKFKALQNDIPDMEMPDSNDPDALERMYYAAARVHHRSSSTGTWMIYLGLGYAAAQWIMTKMGIPGISNYASYQVEVLKHYPHLIKELGNPGGPSIGSSWPPWLKLAVIMVIQSVIYLVITMITKDETRAFGMQKVICSTGIMSGVSKPTTETELAGDGAMSNIGSVLGGLLGGGGGGGMLGNIMNMFAGGNPVDEMDLENPPPPDLGSPTTSTDSGLPSRRTNIFSP